MSLPECRHELPVDSCIDCRPAARADEPTWLAQFETMCHTCHLIIDKGERVTWNPDGGNVVHAHHARSRVRG